MYSDISKAKNRERSGGRPGSSILWKPVTLAMIMCIMLFLTACGQIQIPSIPSLVSGNSETTYNNGSDLLKESYDPEDTWAFYWYLCGSDLETNGGCGTTDLNEMMQVQLPENVSVVVETGGAQKWHNDIDPGSLSRYLYNSNGFQLLEKDTLADMGDSSTLESFLRFCNENYPADHRAVIFWDHGSGSTGGVIFDELYNYDSLSLPEIRTAFEAVSSPSSANPPYEMIGFDACLMATVDMVETLNGFGRFLVASQETEPSGGWDYTSLFQALTDDPTLNGARLGKEICDSYYTSSAAAGAGGTVTLSVVDLSLADALKTAYDNVGAEALAGAYQSTTYFSEFGRAARAAESYGPNNNLEGYTDMVDLGDLVRQSESESLLPDYGQALLDTLTQSVIYRVNGPYRSRATGLSCYYDYDSSHRDFAAFEAIEDNTPFYWFYDYAITGSLPAEGQEYVETWIQNTQGTSDEALKEMAPQDIELPVTDLNDYPVTVTPEGNAVLALGTSAASSLADVYCNLAYYSEQKDLMVFLGMDSELDKDWQNGIFTDTFKDTWGSINGELVYMDILDVDEDYQLYRVPVKLNKEEYSLIVSMTETLGFRKYKILGARKELSENGMSDKNLRQLVPGDVIEPVLYVMQGAEKDFEEITLAAITVTDKTKFEKTDLGDGMFIAMFEMVDIQNNRYFSEAVMFEVEGKNFSMIEE